MYFTNLSAWRIEGADGAAAGGNAGGGSYKAAAPQAAAPNSFINDEADNDLPF
jgi:hypothetical protein